MNNYDHRDISDVEIVGSQKRSFKPLALGIAFAFFMLAISGNFSFRTDDFEVTLNESEARYQKLTSQSEAITAEHLREVRATPTYLGSSGD